MRLLQVLVVRQRDQHRASPLAQSGLGMGIWCGSEPPNVCLQVEYVSLGLDPSWLSWCWQVRKAFDTLANSTHLYGKGWNFSSSKSHELVNSCCVPRQIYLQDSYTELRLNTEQPATTNVINSIGKLLSLCQSADCPCIAPRDCPYSAHSPGLHVNHCSGLSAPAPVMPQHGQASAPHGLPCLATGPAKLDPSTDPHPG